jgi:hypothetical protein
MSKEEKTQQNGKMPSADYIIYRLDEITTGQALMNDKIDSFGALFVPRAELLDWRKQGDEVHVAIRAELADHRKETNNRFNNYNWVIKTLFVMVASALVAAVMKLILK